MSEDVSTNKGRDIRVNGKLVLCACELEYQLANLADFPHPDDIEDESVRLQREDAIKDVIEAAEMIREQIRELNIQGLA